MTNLNGYKYWCKTLGTKFFSSMAWAQKTSLAPWQFLDLLGILIWFLIVPDSSIRALWQLPAETSSSEVGETWREVATEFCPHVSLSYSKDSLTCSKILRHGTADYISPPKKVVLRIFIGLKNRSSSAGFEPTNTGSNDKHATSRPPRATMATVKTSYKGIPMGYDYRYVCTILRWKYLLFIPCICVVTIQITEPRLTGHHADGS
jgi:hypothetical protein